MPKLVRWLYTLASCCTSSSGSDRFCSGDTSSDIVRRLLPRAVSSWCRMAGTTYCLMLSCICRINTSWIEMMVSCTICRYSAKSKFFSCCPFCTSVLYCM
uniref:Putative secreted protein n=1 Tax=Anopheles triannulatus TaxID=58253 RepID=A0A2M4B4S9_9DIPT